METNTVFDNDEMSISVYPSVGLVMVFNKRVPSREANICLVTNANSTNVVYRKGVPTLVTENGADYILQVGSP